MQDTLAALDVHVTAFDLSGLAPTAAAAELASSGREHVIDIGNLRTISAEAECVASADAASAAGIAQKELQHGAVRVPTTPRHAAEGAAPQSSSPSYEYVAAHL